MRNAETAQNLIVDDQRRTDPGTGRIEAGGPVGIGRRVRDKLRRACVEQALEIAERFDLNLHVLEIFVGRLIHKPDMRPGAQHPRRGDQHHRSPVICDDLAEQVQHHVQSFIVRHLPQRAGRFEQHFGDLALAAFLLVQAGVINCDCQLPRDAFQQRAFDGRKRVIDRVSRHQDASEPFAGHQRHPCSGLYADLVQTLPVGWERVINGDKQRLSGSQGIGRRASFVAKVYGHMLRRESDLVGSRQPFTSQVDHGGIVFVLQVDHRHRGLRQRGDLLERAFDDTIDFQRGSNVRADRAQRQQLAAAFLQIAPHARGGDVAQHQQQRTRQIAEIGQRLQLGPQSELFAVADDLTFAVCPPRVQQLPDGGLQRRSAQQIQDERAGQGVDFLIG